LGRLVVSGCVKSVSAGCEIESKPFLEPESPLPLEMLAESATK
jgi:hypothetical protein